MEQEQSVPAEETAAAPPSGEPKPSLFPLFPLTASSSHTTATATTTLAPQWLSNSSFTANISLINDAVTSQLNTLSPPQHHEEDDEDDNRAEEVPLRPSYEILESSESERENEKRKRKKKKKRKRDRSAERGGLESYSSRKSRVRAWADSESNTTKDYYFDSHGDPDNLVFGCIYRY